MAAVVAHIEASLETSDGQHTIQMDFTFIVDGQNFSEWEAQWYQQGCAVIRELAQAHLSINDEMLAQQRPQGWQIERGNAPARW